MRSSLAPLRPAWPALLLLAAFPLAVPQVGGQVPLPAAPTAPSAAGVPTPPALSADPITKGNALAKQAADAAWARLADQLKPSGQKDVATDWAAVATAAGDFRTNFPEHAQSRAAAKVELIATIRLQDNQPNLSPSTAQAVEAFRADPVNPERDRLEVAIVFAQAGLQRRVFATRAERLQAHEDHAADLIRDFPEQPEGYGYQLSLAKAETPATARAMATALLASAAPEPLKQGAQRLLAQQDLVGTKLHLPGAAPALAANRGRPTFLYAWTAKDAGVLAAVRRLAQTGGFNFLGVNLDGDRTTAEAAAVQLELPGLQLYDDGGLDGPLARQLQLTMLVALYLIDADGVIRDVGAHRDPAAAVARLTEGSRP